MANYVYNLIRCKDIKSLNTLSTYIISSNEFNCNEIIPMSNDPKQVFKEILEGGLLDYDQDTQRLFLEQYTVKNLWRKIYWGCTSFWRFHVDATKMEVQFTTDWTAPFGVIKALKEQGLDFDWYYIYEAYDKCYTAEFSLTECVEMEVPIKDNRVKDFCDIWISQDN